MSSKDQHSTRYNNYGNATNTYGKEDNRPWMSQQQFETTLKELQSGDKEAYYDALPWFRMKKAYREALTKAFNLIDNQDEDQLEKPL